MPRKYVNSKEARDFYHRVMDVFVTIQDAQIISNPQVVEASGLGTTLTQFNNFTGIRREKRGYGTPKRWVGARDQVGFTTLFDFCRALDLENPEQMLLTIILRAHGYQANAIAEFLKSPRQAYTFTFEEASTQKLDEE